MKHALVVFAVVTAFVLTLTATASAHGDVGEVQLTKAEQTGPMSVLIQAGVVYKVDGHLAGEAKVSATLSGPSGESVGSTPLTPSSNAGTQSAGAENSLYEAIIELPSAGEWSIALTSQDPTAEASGQFSVVESFGSTSNSADPATPAVGETTDATTAEADVPSATDGATDLTLAAGGSAKPAGKSRVTLYLSIGILIGIVLAFAVARKQRKDKKAKSDQAL